MGKKSAPLQRQKNEAVHMVRMLHDIAWARAWPHLDDWFKSEAFFIVQDRRQLGIA